MAGRVEVYEIVGLVKDTKYSEVKQDNIPLFYIPAAQDSSIGRIHFYVRGQGDPAHRCCRRHFSTPVMTMPRTKKRCIAKNTVSGIRIDNIAPA